MRIWSKFEGLKGMEVSIKIEHYSFKNFERAKGQGLPPENFLNF